MFDRSGWGWNLEAKKDGLEVGGGAGVGSLVGREEGIFKTSI